jgi:DNA-binding response OmpR family regulator
MANQLPALRIMVVDDNRDAADLVAEFLVMCGHDARPIYGGAEALQTANLFSPDVVFLDLGMPGVSGIQVATALRQESRSKHVRIIALTAWGDESTRARTKASGFDHHLVKPAALAEILGVLEKAA